MWQPELCTNKYCNLFPLSHCPVGSPWLFWQVVELPNTSTTTREVSSYSAQRSNCFSSTLKQKSLLERGGHVGSTQNLDPVTVRVLDESQALHLSVVWLLHELNIQSLESLASFVYVRNRYSNVAKPSAYRQQWKRI